ncbi:MAG: hypothetical protein A2W28_12945 [Gammaproteobacteria bacterium RBG_16_51_14]|nr:MAG: hypothetical protein A2W28_12945 [Gammaproteobacteria bacterium RBG_16_51_14]
MSALIKVQNIYAVIIVNDYDAPSLAERQFYTLIYLVGLQDKHKRGAAYDSQRCYYDFNISTDTEDKETRSLP